MNHFTCPDCKKEFPKKAWNQIRCLECAKIHDKQRERITKSKRPKPSKVKFISFIAGLTIGQEQDCRCYLERWVYYSDFKKRLKKYLYPYGIIVEIDGKRFIIKGSTLEER